MLFSTWTTVNLLLPQRIFEKGYSLLVFVEFITSFNTFSKLHMNIKMGKKCENNCRIKTCRISWKHIFKRFYLLIFRERGMEVDREGKKHWCVRETSIGCLSLTPKGDQSCSPDWDSNWRPFGLQDDSQPTESHQSGVENTFLKNFTSQLFLMLSLSFNLVGVNFLLHYWTVVYVCLMTSILQFMHLLLRHFCAK